MKIVGLTGSIAMGKSTAAAMLRADGVPVHDSDKAVHRLTAPGGAAVAPIRSLFGDGVIGSTGGVDRARLGALVFGDPAALTKLEKILHPLVQADAAEFLRRAALARRKLVVLDIPLLMEKGGNRRFDAVWVVSASRLIQRVRALSRPGMSEDKLRAVLSAQMPDAEKRRRGTDILPTGLGMRSARRALAKSKRRVLLSRRRGAWPIRWVPPSRGPMWLRRRHRF